MKSMLEDNKLLITLTLTDVSMFKLLIAAFLFRIPTKELSLMALLLLQLEQRLPEQRLPEQRLPEQRLPEQRRLELLPALRLARLEAFPIASASVTARELRIAREFALILRRDLLLTQ